MDKREDVIELLDDLYGMVTEAWAVPLGNDKCIIERDKVVDILNRIKDNLPSELAEAKRVVATREEFIEMAKREAEAMRKNAEEKSKTMIEEQEIVRAARAKSTEMLNSAEMKSNELRRVASEYVDELMRQTETNVSEALAKLQSAHNAFRSLGTATVRQPQTEAPVQEAESGNNAKPKPVAPTANPQKRQGVPLMRTARDN